MTGTISIHGEVVDGRLRKAIADSAAAFLPEIGGDGITGIRERLAVLFGAGAVDALTAGVQSRVARLRE